MGFLEPFKAGASKLRPTGRIQCTGKAFPVVSGADSPLGVNVTHTAQGETLGSCVYPEIQVHCLLRCVIRDVSAQSNHAWLHLQSEVV